MPQEVMDKEVWDLLNATMAPLREVCLFPVPIGIEHLAQLKGHPKDEQLVSLRLTPLSRLDFQVIPMSLFDNKRMNEVSIAQSHAHKERELLLIQ